MHNGEVPVWERPAIRLPPRSFATASQSTVPLSHIMIEEDIMKLHLWSVTVVLTVLGGFTPVYAVDEEVFSLTTQAVKDLNLYPSNGKRASAYEQPEGMAKFWDADHRQYRKATVKLKAALEQARQTGVPKEAIVKLEEAVQAGESGYHRDARLLAQGALADLSKGMAEAALPTCKG